MPSLRTRWNRAFALLTVMILLSGLAGLLGSSLLVDTFRNSAVRAEREATISARLRAEVIAHSILVTSRVTGTQQRQLDASQSKIKQDFALAIADEDTATAEKLLRKSLAQWQAIVEAAGPPGQPADIAMLGGVVATEAPKVLALLDRSDSANRVAVRVELANAGRGGFDRHPRGDRRRALTPVPRS